MRRREQPATRPHWPSAGRQQFLELGRRFGAALRVPGSSGLEAMLLRWLPKADVVVFLPLGHGQSPPSETAVTGAGRARGASGSALAPASINTGLPPVTATHRRIA